VTAAVAGKAASAAKDEETRARRTIRGWQRTGFGRPPPIPPWAIAIVGGALTAPVAAWTTSRLVQHRASQGGADLGTTVFLVLMALVVFGIASGALATIATGHSERRVAVLGGALGAGTGLTCLGAVWVHEAFFLAAVVALTTLPAALVAVARRLPAREAVPLWALSLLAVGTGALPIGLAIVVVNRFVVHMRQEVVLEVVASAVGALAWYMPAGYRPGARS